MTTDEHGECTSQHGNNQVIKKGRGPSSAWMHKPQMVLEKIEIQPGWVFVDLGCGAGDYTLEASKAVGGQGRVYALDKWSYLIENLTGEAESLGLTNITPITADITDPLPLEDGLADVVFIATVLHIFNLKKISGVIFPEAARIIKPGGRLAIVECKKEDAPHGPPKHLRNAPDEIEAALAPYPFEKTSYSDLGRNYMIQFTRLLRNLS